MDDERTTCEKRVGTTLCGKWTIDRLLGIGGMAAVYAATHKIGRREAIKILHPEVARSMDIRARFEREAHAVNRFRHPGVVEIRDIDTTDDGAPFLVMELLEGESLADRLQRLGTLDPTEVLRLVDELLDVLDAAHGQEIIHRDIKLDNLFVEHGGRLKVLDFGIARMHVGVKTAMRTRTGATLGTVSYMAPEQVRGISVDHRADLFAVGATMFRLIAKRRLHEARTEPELLVKMATMPAPPLGTVAPETPRELCMVVDRALAFDREQRYPNARTMQEDVRALRQGKEPPFAAARLAAGELPSGGAPAPRLAAAKASAAELKAVEPSKHVEPQRSDPEVMSVKPSGLGRASMPSQVAAAKPGQVAATKPGTTAVGTELSFESGPAHWDAPTVCASDLFDSATGAPQGAPVSVTNHGARASQGGKPTEHTSARAPRRAPPRRSSKLLLVLAIGGAAFSLGLAIGVWRILDSRHALEDVSPAELAPDSGSLSEPSSSASAESASSRPTNTAQSAAPSSNASASPRSAPSAKPATKGSTARPITTITIDWRKLSRSKKKRQNE